MRLILTTAVAIVFVSIVASCDDVNWETNLTSAPKKHAPISGATLSSLLSITGITGTKKVNTYVLDDEELVTSSTETSLKENRITDGQASAISYETKWFTQLVDHFTWTNEDTWQQRYLVNTDHWCGKNCPILFYCGNEGDIEMFTNNTGWMWENAEKLHAMLVFAEHRFYGRSMPYKIDPTRKSPESVKKHGLGYLSSEQALADYARLIFELKNSIYDAKYSPVVAIGGSYGGMLAAWLRMKYPNTVVGALAGSAPILQFEGEYECNKFMQIVTKDFEGYSPNCSHSIAKSWSTLTDYATKQPHGLADISRAFHTCEQLGDASEVESLKELLSSIWVNMAMTDYANEAKFLSKMPPYPIKHSCAELNADPLGGMSDLELIERIARASQVYTNFTGQLRCLDIEGQLTDPMDTLWDFQSCTEMVMPICSDGVNDMFEALPWNLNKFISDCKTSWGVKTQVNKVRTLYGDSNLSSASQIIFSSCTRDPWSAGCPSKSIKENSIHAIVIEGVCHHEDLRPTGANDSDALRKARQDELNIISDWIQKHYNEVKQQVSSTETVQWTR